MNFGRSTDCQICRKKIEGDYCRYYCTFAGIDMEFYTHPGECNNKFRGEYVEPFESIGSRWEILDIR